VSAALVSSDGLMLLSRRSHRVAKYAGRIHPVSGVVETAGAAPDVFAAMLKELREELGLEADGIRRIVCLGLVRDKSIVQPELVFDVEASLEASAIRRAWGAAGCDEFAELTSVRNHPGSFVAFIQEHGDRMTPVAQATMLLHGLRHWGCGWFTAARGYLHRVI